MLIWLNDYHFVIKHTYNNIFYESTTFSNNYICLLNIKYMKIIWLPEVIISTNFS